MTLDSVLASVHLCQRPAPRNSSKHVSSCSLPIRTADSAHVVILALYYLPSAFLSIQHNEANSRVFWGSLPFHVTLGLAACKKSFLLQICRHQPLQSGQTHRAHPSLKTTENWGDQNTNETTSNDIAKMRGLPPHRMALERCGQSPHKIAENASSWETEKDASLAHARMRTLDTKKKRNNEKEI